MPRHIVCLTFDFDTQSGFIARGMTTPTALSRGEFGLTGAVAMISVFRRRAARCATAILGGITQGAAHDGDDPAAMSGAVTSIERRRLRGTRGILQSVQTNCPPCEPVHILPGAAMACSMHRRPRVDHSH